jgi:hypothetical protein
VLPTLERLGGDALWRVRERVITQLPLLVQTLVRGGRRARERESERAGEGVRRSKREREKARDRETE